MAQVASKLTWLTILGIGTQSMPSHGTGVDVGLGSRASYRNCVTTFLRFPTINSIARTWPDFSEENARLQRGQGQTGNVGLSMHLNNI